MNLRQPLRHELTQREWKGSARASSILLGGGLAVAVLFFVFTAVVGKSPKKPAQVRQPSQQAKQEVTKPPKGSVTPLMDTVRTPAPDNSSGQLGPGDIRRTRSLNDQAHLKPVAAKPAAGDFAGKRTLFRGYTAEMGRSSAIRRISCGADLAGAAEWPEGAVHHLRAEPGAEPGRLSAESQF